MSCIILSLSGVLVPGLAEFRTAGMFAALVLRSHFGLPRRMRQRNPDRQQMLDQRERSGQRRISVIRTYADIAYLQACRTEGGFGLNHAAATPIPNAAEFVGICPASPSSASDSRKPVGGRLDDRKCGRQYQCTEQAALTTVLLIRLFVGVSPRYLKLATMNFVPFQCTAGPPS